jgi:hypothetical protein
MNKHQKGFSLIVILISILFLLLIVGAVYFLLIKNNQNSLPQQNQESLQSDKQDVYESILNSSGEKFVYLSGYKVYLYDAKTKKQVLLPIEKNVWDMCVNSSYEIFYTDSADTFLYSYNINNQKSEIIKDFVGFGKEYDVKLDKPSFFSRDCHYVSLGYANKSPFRIYDIKEKKLIDSAVNGSVIWSPNNDYFIQTEIVDLYYYFKHYLGSINDNKAILSSLFSGNKYQAFDIEWIDNDNIAYKRQTYSMPFIDGLPKEVVDLAKIDYFKININDGESVVADENTKEIFDKKELISPSGEYKITISKDLNFSKSDGTDSVSVVFDYYGRSRNNAIWLPVNGN